MSMGVNYDIPFYANTLDGTHCVQAVFKMITEHFRPDLVLSFEEWERISHKRAGGWTWTMSGLIWLKEAGFEVENVEYIDYHRFSSEGVAFLEELWGIDVASIQGEKTNIPEEQEIAKLFIEEIEPKVRLPNADDLKNMLENGYLLAVTVNSRILNAREGYAGHLVVVKGYDDTGFFLNDPGLPPLENRHVDYALFTRAWAYPNDNARNLAAIRGAKQ